jgi:hypothetical protein
MLLNYPRKGMKKEEGDIVRNTRNLGEVTDRNWEFKIFFFFQDDDLSFLILSKIRVLFLNFL